MATHKSKNRYIPLGILLIAIGILFFSVQEGWLNPSVKQILLAWPAFLLYLGLYLLTRKKRNFGCIVLLFGIGGFFTLERVFTLFPELSPWDIDLTNFGIYFLPFILVLMGCYFIFRPSCSKNKKKHKNRKQQTNVEFDNRKQGYYDKNVILGYSEQILLESEFLGGEINVICGSAVLDLRKAILPPEGCSLKIHVIMGEVIIYTPETWNVANNTDIVLSEFKNKRLKDNDSTDAPTLTLNGLVMLGTCTLI